MRRRQRPGNSTWTSVSTSRTNAWSGPPRARIASRSSGRRAQAEANAARRMEAAILAIGMRRGWVTGFVLAGWLVACRHVTPPRPAPAPPAAPEDEVSLEGGFLTVHVAVPSGPGARKPAVIAPPGDHGPLHPSNLALHGHPLALGPDYDAWLRTQEPIRHPESLVHAALLMVNGAEDRAVPLSCAEATARTLQRAYVRRRLARRFRFVVVPSVGHVLGPRATDATMAWWRRVLAHERACRC